MKDCLGCGGSFEAKNKEQKFCNSSCSARYNNSRRVHSEKTKDKIRNSAKIYAMSNPKPKPIKQCVICGTEFVKQTRSGVRKTCSGICNSVLLSRNAVTRIQEVGANYKTQIKQFAYKDHATIHCDSKLEAAAVIWLYDSLQVDTVKRFSGFLNYYNEFEHNFYPDFVAQKDNKTYVIEVKMPHLLNKVYSNYNDSIPMKKVALEKYCEENNFISMWLDFENEPSFKVTYRKFLEDYNAFVYPHATNV